MGKVQVLNLYPLCFAEYLKAAGDDEAAKTILGTPQMVSQTVHEFLCEELRRYFFIVGMPESVMAYLETGSLQESRGTVGNLWDLQDGFRKIHSSH